MASVDELARSTIELSISDVLLFNIEGFHCVYSIWTRLEELYAQKTAANKVFWLKKLMDLRMKEGTPMSTHLSEFNSIFSQLVALKFIIDDKFKDTFL